jgi:DNA-binding XRE family transcriptional regulator
MSINPNKFRKALSNAQKTDNFYQRDGQPTGESIKRSLINLDNSRREENIKTNEQIAKQIAENIKTNEQIDKNKKKENIKTNEQIAKNNHQYSPHTPPGKRPTNLRPRLNNTVKKVKTGGKKHRKTQRKRR